jgi:HSP20 family protein
MSEVKVTKEVAPRATAPLTPFGELFAPMVPFGRMFGFNPFGVMREFSEEMDNMYKNMAPKMGAEFFAPAVDIKLAAGNLIVTADLPGLKKEEVKIEVTGDALVIEGERKRVEKEEKEGYKKYERTYGKFYRTIPLPEGAKIEMAKAELTEGVLTITVPVPEVKARQVPIEEANKGKAKAA